MVRLDIVNITFLPKRYVRRAALSGHAEILVIRNAAAENMEFSGKVKRVVLEGVSGHVALDCNQDMEIACGGMRNCRCAQRDEEGIGHKCCGRAAFYGLVRTLWNGKARRA